MEDRNGKPSGSTPTAHGHFRTKTRMQGDREIFVPRSILTALYQTKTCIVTLCTKTGGTNVQHRNHMSHPRSGLMVVDESLHQKVVNFLSTRLVHSGFPVACCRHASRAVNSCDIELGATTLRQVRPIVKGSGAISVERTVTKNRTTVSEEMRCGSTLHRVASR